MINLSLTGDVELKKVLTVGLKPKISKAIIAVANFMQNTAKKNLKEALGSSSKSYTRTGKAQQSITVESLNWNKAKVKQGVKYGKYIEYGTGIPAGRQAWWVRADTLRKAGMKIDGNQKYIKMKGMKPRPFWIPAVKSTQKEAINLFKKEL